MKNIIIIDIESAYVNTISNMDDISVELMVVEHPRYIEGCEALAKGKIKNYFCRVYTYDDEFYDVTKCNYNLTLSDIEKYRKCPLLVAREDAVELDDDEYFIADMIGMEVLTEDGKVFGTLKDVMETGANDVYVIDSIEHGEVLVPAIKECILNVNIEECRMKIHLMDGLV